MFSQSMRENYNNLGVEQYYQLVASTYRNPHFIPVKKCLYKWLNTWWEHRLELSENRPIGVFDMACGSGEVTESVLNWLHQARDNTSKVHTLGSGSRKSIPWQLTPPSISNEDLKLYIIASDPYTSPAYQSRTKRRCEGLSFEDISEGKLPVLPSGVSFPIDMTICSFALHLIRNPSQLFSLLYQLSLKSRWLIVIAPGKQPEIKEGWGWRQWDIGAWNFVDEEETNPHIEILDDRVHLRAFKSVNLEPPESQ